MAGHAAFTLRVRPAARAVCLLHHSTTRGRGRRTCLSRRWFRRCDGSRRPASGRSLSPALTSGPSAAISEEPTSLVALLTALEGLSLDVTLRISSARADGLQPGDRGVGCLQRVGHFAPHFHLPLQHASNRMLAMMRRPTRSTITASGGLDHRQVAACLDRVRHDCGVSGETDEDFAVNLGYLPASPLTHLHVFPYSGPGWDRGERHGRESLRPPPRSAHEERNWRAIGATLTKRFHDAQVGTRRGSRSTMAPLW